MTHILDKDVVLRLAALALAACAVNSTVPLAGQSLDGGIERTTQLIVMIEGHLDGGSTFGAGILFGGDADRAYIVTANHVVRRQMREAERLQVLLRSQPGKWLRARLLPHADPSPSGLDLAVLALEGPERHALAFCDLPFDRLGQPANLKRGNAVYPVGYPQEAPWGMPVSPDRIAQTIEVLIQFESPYVRPGHSGGGLLMQDGRLVGLITKDQDPYGSAVSIEHVLQVLRKWGYPVHLHIPLEKGRKPLHEAALKGDVSALKRLLAQGICKEQNVPDDHGATPLHFATSSGSLEVAGLLLNAGAAVNAADNDGDMPLHWAAETGKVESARLLLNAGAKIESRNRAGWTPLHWAAGKGYRTFAEFLVKAGANVNARSTGGGILNLLIFTNGKGLTPLHLAVGNGHVGVAELLVASGANINTRGHRDGKPLTPLGNAVRWHQFVAGRSGASNGLKNMRLLVEAGAKVEASELCNNLAGPPASYELEMSKIVYRAILNINAKVDGCHAPDDTLLSSAAGRGSRELVELLLAAGADINASGFNGFTPVVRAIVSEHTQLAEFLIARGAKLPEGGGLDDRVLRFLRSRRANR